MALTPIQDLAECARRPATLIAARRVPWQPPSMAADVGSSKIAKSPASSSGLVRASRPSPLRAASTSSQS